MFHAIEPLFKSCKSSENTRRGQKFVIYSLYALKQQHIWKNFARLHSQKTLLITVREVINYICRVVGAPDLTILLTYISTKKDKNQPVIAHINFVIFNSYVNLNLYESRPTSKGRIWRQPRMSIPVIGLKNVKRRLIPSSLHDAKRSKLLVIAPFEQKWYLNNMEWIDLHMLKLTKSTVIHSNKFNLFETNLKWNDKLSRVEGYFLFKSKNILLFGMRNPMIYLGLTGVYTHRQYFIYIYWYSLIFHLFTY